MSIDAIEPLEFTLGHRTIVATQAQRLDPQRFLYRLEISPLTILGYIRIRALRLALQRLLHYCTWLKAFRPDWFLPSTIILKKQKFNEIDIFKTERRAYHVLEYLQGTVLPYCYGEASYDGSPALVLSEIQGETLHQTANSELDDPALKNRLENAYRGLHELGVIHGDAELHNIFDDGQRVMLVDFEFAELGETVIWEESLSRGDVGNVMCEYQRRRPALQNRKAIQ